MTAIRIIVLAGGVFGAVLALAAGEPGARPEDETLSCAQIAAELMPYMQEIMPSAMAAAAAAQDVVKRGEQRVAQEAPAAEALTVAATLSHLDPTGLAGRAVGQAEVALQKEAWERSLAEDKPLHDQYARQAGQLVTQGQQMQNNPRLQRLMQLIQEKRCDEQ